MWRISLPSRCGVEIADSVNYTTNGYIFHDCAYALVCTFETRNNDLPGTVIGGLCDLNDTLAIFVSGRPYGSRRKA